MMEFINGVPKHQSEFVNLLASLILVTLLLYLIYDILRNDKGVFFSILPSVTGAITLGMRIWYYVNVILGNYTRASHGTTFVANPTPFLWVSLAAITFILIVSRQRNREILEEMSAVREYKSWS